MCRHLAGSCVDLNLRGFVLFNQVCVFFCSLDTVTVTSPGCRPGWGPKPHRHPPPRDEEALAVLKCPGRCPYILYLPYIRVFIYTHLKAQLGSLH